jgi:hypothetical protein
MVVVLPAPLGPSKPKISPVFTVNDKRSTANTILNDLVNACNVIAFELFISAYVTCAVEHRWMKGDRCPLLNL